MVLLLKQWKSRSSPGIVARYTKNPFPCPPRATSAPGRPFLADPSTARLQPAAERLSTQGPFKDLVAGWSSPVARQAHNLKVTGSNPVPATIFTRTAPTAPAPGAVLVCSKCEQLRRFGTTWAWSVRINNYAFSRFAGVSGVAEDSLRRAVLQWVRWQRFHATQVAKATRGCWLCLTAAGQSPPVSCRGGSPRLCRSSARAFFPSSSPFA